MNGKQRSVQFRKDAKNSNFMKRFIHLILLMAFTVGCSSKRLSEHEAICHISGDGIDVKKEYDIEKRRPDVIYIHNPYDKGNFVTSVHPAFYSDELKKYVKKSRLRMEVSMLK